MPKITIVTLNWNGYEDTLELLESLKKISYQNFDVVLVDNGSEGDDVEKLESNYGGFVKVLRNKSNLGFAGGNNEGIKIALQNNADYVLLINNDTVVEPDILHNLIQKFNTDERIGIVAPKINFYAEPQKIWSAGGKISKLRGSAISFSVKRGKNTSLKDELVDFVSGCCMLIKRNLFSEIGYFDEKYFLYMEDADYCWRAADAGFKIVCVPQCTILHKVNSSSSDKYQNLPLYYMTRNRLYFAKKLFPKYIGIVYTYILISMIIKSVYWLLTGRKNKILVVKKAFTDFKLNALGKMKEY